MKTLIISVYNTFLGTKLVDYTFPFDPRKSARGYYSSFWKKSKINHANIEHVDKNFIRAKVFLGPVQSERMNVKFPSGVVFDCPSNLDKIDIEIINLHLKALQLGLYSKNENLRT